MSTRTNAARAGARCHRPRKPPAVSKATTLDDAVTTLIAAYKPAGTLRAKSIALALRRAADTLWGVKLGHVGGGGAATGTRWDSEPLTIGDIARDDVRKCIPYWLTHEGLTAADANMVLHLLSTLGIDCQDLWASRTAPPLPPNRWLSPDSFSALLKWLRTEAVLPREAVLVADLLEWAAWTGSPLVETLRLQWEDIRRGVPTVTSTHSSTILLGLMPAIILKRRRAERPAPDEPCVFPISHRSLCAHWELCRMFLGVTGNPLAALEGLRLPLPLADAYRRQPKPLLAVGHPYLVGVGVRAMCDGGERASC
jgi:hypothetical protein